MKRTQRFTTAMVCVLCLAGVAGADTAEEAQPVTQQEPCCFENPRFSGTCSVTPGEGESCSSILGYLNNPNSVGKSYCGNTKVRGGWTQVSCEKPASAFSAGTCDAGEPKK
jgi:hypothetical protein